MAEHVIAPQPGPQTAFLSCSAYEAGYGGAVAGGKTWSIGLVPLRWVDRPTYKAKLFRRTYPQLEGSLLPETSKIYPRMGAVYNQQKHTWLFPSGAKVQLSHLQHTQDIQDHFGQPYQTLGIDEINTFESEQVHLLQGWLRSAEGIPIRFRWGSNPVDDDKHWLLKRYAPWIYGALPEGSERRLQYKGITAAPGEALWVAKRDGDTEERFERSPFQLSTTPAVWAPTRTFFPAKLTDNKILMAADPEYAARVMATGETNSKRLLDGDWFAREVAGAMFAQEMWNATRVEVPPKLVRVGVGVDPAVSNTARSDEHGIIVGGVSEDQHLYIFDDWSRKGDPDEWARAVFLAYSRNNADMVIAEKNQGGDMVKSTIHTASTSIPVELVNAWRGKRRRLEPLAYLAKQGRVHIVGSLPEFEAESRRWVPDVSKWSPNRLDAFGHLGAWLIGDGTATDDERIGPEAQPSHPSQLLQARLDRREKQAREAKWEDGLGEEDAGEDWTRRQEEPDL